MEEMPKDDHSSHGCCSAKPQQNAPKPAEQKAQPKPEDAPARKPASGSCCGGTK